MQNVVSERSYDVCLKPSLANHALHLALTQKIDIFHSIRSVHGMYLYDLQVLSCAGKYTQKGCMGSRR